MSIVNVAEDFHHRLTNRNKLQGDGKFHAEDFRDKYLKEFDNQDVWKQGTRTITFDFTNVKKIGPSFANEAFAYFTQYAKPEKVLSQIKFINVSRVQDFIIKQEVKSGYVDRR